MRYDPLYGSLGVKGLIVFAARMQLPDCSNYGASVHLPPFSSSSDLEKYNLPVQCSEHSARCKSCLRFLSERFLGACYSCVASYMGELLSRYDQRSGGVLRMK